MDSFVITLGFDVGPQGVPLGRDVIAKSWGAGHRFSYCDGRILTLVVEVSAPDAAQAGELVRARAGIAWGALTGQVLPPPSQLRLQGVAPAREKRVAGVARSGPDQLIADAAASRAARLRAAVAALSELSELSELCELSELSGRSAS